MPWKRKCFEQEIYLPLPSHHDFHNGLHHVGTHEPDSPRSLHGMARQLAQPIHHRVAYGVCTDDGGVASIYETRSQITDSRAR